MARMKKLRATPVIEGSHQPVSQSEPKNSRSRQIEIAMPAALPSPAAVPILTTANSNFQLAAVVAKKKVVVKKKGVVKKTTKGHS